MKKITRVLLSALIAIILSSIWLFIINISNSTIESIGIGVIVFVSVMLFANWKTKLNEKLKLISIIFLYLLSGFILYVLTEEHKTLFLLYKFIYGILFFIILYYAYKYLAKKYK